jgi:peptide/nickel transport system substrate-binding protein
MQTRSRRVGVLAGAAALAVLASACGGSSGGSGGTPTPSSSGSGTSGFQKISTNSGGTPVTGGTLNVLSSSDTDYLDPNVTYYSLGYAYVRPYNRSLYGYPSIEGKQTEAQPDAATAAPEISADGLTYKVTIKNGIKWNTSPSRQVTAADVVRGVKTSCNPAQPFGGLPDFDFLIKGMTKFCADFKKVATNAKAIGTFTEKTDLPGVQVDPSNPETVIFTLTQPASFFASMLALPTFSPRAKEMLDYVPASTQAAQHTVADGPYQVDSYEPTKQITYTRNKAWDPATDTIHKAYVNKIIVTMTNTDPEVSLKQLQAGTPSADLMMNGVPAADIPLLLNDPNLTVESEIASNPYVLFNTQSPNNGKALEKVDVRKALSYALNRNHLIQVAAGPKISPPLTHVLPDAIHGSTPIDLYPHDQAKAKQMLTTAGVSGMKLKFLFRPSSPTSKKMFQVVQQDLSLVGVTVTGVPAQDADFYTKYLQNPSSARKGQWDVSLAGWGPDWYGDAALSFFGPLFDGRVLPPTSSNFGLFNDATVNQLIDQAKAAKTLAEANSLWAKADRQVMEQAAFFPITNPNEGQYHPAFVHDTVYSPVTQNYDWTNVWIDKNKQGG